jgi:hypothetical protein
MASGHVNRIKRPNTWLHRPTLQNVKNALANPEPSTHGTFEIIDDVRYLRKIGSDVRNHAFTINERRCDKTVASK